MKKLLAVEAAFLLFAGLYSPAMSQESGRAAVQNKKVLVAYYSHSGTTKRIAGQIRDAVGGDIFEIQTVKSYPDNYDKFLQEAKKEINDGFKPALKTKIGNISDYDVIFIGSPNWWGTIPPAVNSFLSSYDFSGKTIIPFNTNGGGGAQNCFEDVKKILSKSTVAEGKAFSARNDGLRTEEISEWLSKINPARK
jgi:flavodoxin